MCWEATITKRAVAWVGSVQPECTVPLSTWSFRNFKPEFLLNGKRPKISRNFGPKLNGSVRSSRKSFEKLMRWTTFPGRTGLNWRDRARCDSEQHESVFRSCNSAREGKYTATTLRKKILSISQRIKILTDSKILLRTSLRRVYGKHYWYSTRCSIRKLRGVHSTYFCRT